MKKFYVLSAELSAAMGKMSKANLLKVSFGIVWNAVKCTYYHKANIVKSVYKGLNRKAKQIKNQGVKTTVKNDVINLKNGSCTAFRKALTSMKDFSALNFTQKKLFLKDAVMYAIFFVPVMLLVAGGIDLEGGAPDFDMKVSSMFSSSCFKWHRNVFSHTILIGFGIEVLIRITAGVIRKIYCYLSENHDRVWDDINKITPSAKSASIAAAWMGIGFHLFKDSKLLSGYKPKIKPYVGLPFSMADNMHQNMFGVNGLMAGGISLKRG